MAHRNIMWRTTLGLMLVVAMPLTIRAAQHGAPGPFHAGGGGIHVGGGGFHPGGGIGIGGSHPGGFPAGGGPPHIGGGGFDPGIHIGGGGIHFVQPGGVHLRGVPPAGQFQFGAVQPRGARIRGGEIPDLAARRSAATAKVTEGVRLLTWGDPFLEAWIEAIRGALLTDAEYESCGLTRYADPFL